MVATAAVNIGVRDFTRVYIPMLLSFMTARILVQTDLVMVAPLGEFATAAFAVPMRVMLIDTIIALAIGPVISVAVSHSRPGHDRAEIVNNALSFALYVGLALLVLGLLAYPVLVNVIIENQEVARLANPAVFWLTLAIPARFLQFIGSMILFAVGRGHLLIPMFLTAVGANALLNWIFIYHLNLGFEGSYIGTLLISHMEMVWTLWLLRDHASLKNMFRFRWRMVKQFTNNIGAEFARVMSWHLVWFVLLIMFSKDPTGTARLSAYSVSMELYFFVTMPLIAAMRCTAVLLAPCVNYTYSQLYIAIRPIAVGGTLITVLVALILVFTSPFLATMVFHLGENALPWWRAFILFFCIILPLNGLNSLQKGLWHSRQLFQPVFIAELLSSWLILVPVLYIGLVRDAPWIGWSGLAIMEVGSAAVLYIFRRRLSSESRESGIRDPINTKIAESTSS